MLRYALSRLPSALGVLAVASVVIFALLRLVPGDPAQVLAGPDASAESLAALREQLGLTGSQIGQYFAWLGGLLTGDPGTSLVVGGEIGSLIIAATGNTLVLGLSALAIGVGLALLLSLTSVVLDKAWLNSLVAGFSTLAVAIPNFVTGVLLVLVFGVLVPVLPAGGTPPDGLWANPSITAQYLLMPALCLALPMAASLTRFLSEGLRSQLAEPYATTARALGIRRRTIVLRWALPAALPSAVTVTGLQVGHLLGGAVLIESIFAWPGLGHLLERAISGRDYPLVQVLLLLSVAVFVLVQVVTDLINSTLDPRIRLGKAA